MATRPPTQYYFPGFSRLYTNLDEWAHTLLRIALGLVLIPHGMQKLFSLFSGPGMNGFIGILQKVGYPPNLAPILGWLIALVEFGGGILLVIGLFTRPVAFAVLIFMLEAVRYHYGRTGTMFWTTPGGGFEYPLILAALAIYLIIRGAGSYSVDARMRKEF